MSEIAFHPLSGFSLVGATKKEQQAIDKSFKSVAIVGSVLTFTLNDLSTVDVTLPTTSSPAAASPTWAEIVVGSLPGETLASGVIKYSKGGIFYYRKIIESPYSDIIYSDTALTNEIAKRGD